MNILILKSFGLGNQIMLSPIIRALHVKGHNVFLLSDNGPLGFPSKKLFSSWKCLADIYEFNREGKRDGNDVIEWIRSKNIDLCIESFPSDSLFEWLLPLINVPIRKAPIITGFWDKHEVDYNFEIVKDLVGENKDISYYLPIVSTPKISNILFELETSNPKKRVVISPSYKRSGLWWKKHWGNDKYAELVWLLADKYNVFLVDGKEGIGDCNAINFMSGGKAINLAGRLEISDTMDIVNSADLVIANDSGVAHIAAAYKKKLLVLFGPTSSVKSSPISPNTFVLKSNLECMPCQGTKLWEGCRSPDCLKVLEASRIAELAEKVINE